MSAKLVTYNDYVAGWLDTSIHDFLEVLSPGAANTKYALITCIDSNQDPASLLDKGPELRAIAKRVQIIGSALLLPALSLLAADSRSRIFFGFDEVFFFSSKNVQQKPTSLSLVGPARLSQVRFRKLGKWMADNSCSLALGGGEGLNFAVRSRGLGKFLLGFSIEQGEPMLANV